MLVACRLAGLSALGAHYAGVNLRAQRRPTPALLRSVSAPSCPHRSRRMAGISSVLAGADKGDRPGSAMT